MWHLGQHGLFGEQCVEVSLQQHVVLLRRVWMHVYTALLCFLCYAFCAMLCAMLSLLCFLCYAFCAMLCAMLSVLCFLCYAILCYPVHYARRLLAGESNRDSGSCSVGKRRKRGASEQSESFHTVEIHAQQHWSSLWPTTRWLESVTRI